MNMSSNATGNSGQAAAAGASYVGDSPTPVQPASEPITYTHPPPIPSLAHALPGRMYARHTPNYPHPTTMLITSAATAAAAARQLAQSKFLASFDEEYSSSSTSSSDAPTSDDEATAINKQWNKRNMPHSSFTETHGSSGVEYSKPFTSTHAQAAREKIISLIEPFLNRRVAEEIEHVLFTRHRNVNNAYSTRARELIANLSVLQNASSSLLVDILNGVLTPKELVTLPASALAPDSLRRERLHNDEQLLKTSYIRQKSQEVDLSSSIRVSERKRDEAASKHLDATIHLHATSTPSIVSSAGRSNGIQQGGTIAPLLTPLSPSNNTQSEEGKGGSGSSNQTIQKKSDLELIMEKFAPKHQGTEVQPQRALATSPVLSFATAGNASTGKPSRGAAMVGEKLNLNKASKRQPSSAKSAPMKPPSTSSSKSSTPTRVAAPSSSDDLSSSDDMDLVIEPKASTDAVAATSKPKSAESKKPTNGKVATPTQKAPASAKSPSSVLTPPQSKDSHKRKTPTEATLPAGKSLEPKLSVSTGTTNKLPSSDQTTAFRPGSVARSASPPTKRPRTSESISLLSPPPLETLNGEIVPMEIVGPHPSQPTTPRAQTPPTSADPAPPAKILPPTVHPTDPITLPTRTTRPAFSSFDGRLSFAFPRRGELPMSFYALPTHRLFASSGPLSTTEPQNKFDVDCWKQILPFDLNEPKKMKASKLEIYIKHKANLHLSNTSNAPSPSIQAASKLHPVTFAVESTDPLLNVLYQDTSEFYRANQLAIACDYESSRIPSHRQCNVWLIPPHSLHFLTQSTAKNILKWSVSPKPDEWWGIIWMKSHVFKSMRKSVEQARRKAESELDVPSDEEGANETMKPRTFTPTPPPPPTPTPIATPATSTPAAQPSVPTDPIASANPLFALIQNPAAVATTTSYLDSLLSKLGPARGASPVVPSPANLVSAAPSSHFSFIPAAQPQNLPIHVPQATHPIVHAPTPIIHQPRFDMPTVAPTLHVQQSPPAVYMASAVQPAVPGWQTSTSGYGAASTVQPQMQPTAAPSPWKSTHLQPAAVTPQITMTWKTTTHGPR